MSLDELFAGLDRLQAGVQQYSIGQGMRQAQDHIDQLNASSMDELDKRAAAQQISQQMASNLLGLGAPVSQVQAAASTLAPAPIKDAQDAYLQGVLKKSDQLKAIGVQGQSFEQAPLDKRQSQQLASQDKLNLRDNTTKMLVAQMEMAAKKNGSLKPLEMGELDKIQGWDEEHLTAKDLLAQVKTNSDLVGPGAKLNITRQFQPEKATFDQGVSQWFNAYRKRITGAGASEGELKMLEASIPSISDRPPVFEAKMNKVLQLGDTVKNRYLSNLSRAGRDVSGFLPGAGSSGAAPVASSTPQPVQRRLKDGTTGMFVQRADGQWERVK
jgi:hypothetical protein